jgi:hypothetical protein
MEIINGEPSLRLATPELDLCVTLQGGHLAPVEFHLSRRDVSPYALAPWQPAEWPAGPPLLTVLRGDFLCLPFGGQVAGPPHGEVANGEWRRVSQTARSLHLTMKAADTGAEVEKIFSVRPGQTAIFAEHRITQLEGDFSYGNHPILDLSELAEGAGRISVSPFRWASTFPGAFSDLADGATQALAEGARFTNLQQVPLAAGGTTDLSRYPARAGNDDLVMMVNAAATAEQPFAWSAVVLDGYVWFSLKNPADFPATMLWLSNGGRTAAPWNGRHTGRLGVEEVCSYFSHGVDFSRQNLLAAEGIATTRHFKATETVSLKTLQAAALVGADFGTVLQILPAGDHAVTLIGEGGERILVPLDWKFLF